MVANEIILVTSHEMESKVTVFTRAWKFGTTSVIWFAAVIRDVFMGARFWPRLCENSKLACSRASLYPSEPLRSPCAAI